MSTEINRNRSNKTAGLSLDGWAVLLALLLSFAVRFGLLPKVPW
jgi:hypothetical protein